MAQQIHAFTAHIDVSSLKHKKAQYIYFYFISVCALQFLKMAGQNIICLAKKCFLIVEK